MKRVNHYSQEQRDLSIRTADPAPKPRKLRQSSRDIRKREEIDTMVGAMGLLVVIAVALFVVGLMR
jgi:hypothetical protein